MEVDDNGTGVKISLEEKPLTPQQKLCAQANAIAMSVFGDAIKEGRFEWGFESRRRLEKRIEGRIESELFPDRPDEAPRVRLTRDGKTKLVSLLLKPRDKPTWGEKFRQKK